MFAIRRTRGNALIELVILLDLYALLLLGLIYIGDLTGIRTKLQPAAEETASRLKDTTPASLETRHFSAYADGTLSRYETSADSFPEPGELREMIEYLVHPPVTTSASGHWQFINGVLVPVVSVNQDQRPAELNDKCLQDRVPELLEISTSDGTSEYMYKSAATLQYRYDPGFIKVGPVSLPGQDVESQHTTLLRGELERPVGATAQGHPIESILQQMPAGQEMPDFPDFQSGSYHQGYWLPDKGR